MQKKKRLDDDQLNWIRDTDAADQQSGKSKKSVRVKPQRTSSPAELGVLKQYVSAEKETAKPQRKKMPVRIKKVASEPAKSSKLKTAKAPAAKSAKAAVTPQAAKKETAPRDTVKSKAEDVIGVVKKESNRITDTLAKPLKSVAKLDIKKGLHSIVSVAASPMQAISSLDRNIASSIQKIKMPDNGNLIDCYFIKPVQNIDDSISRTVKKFLDSVL